MTRLLALTAILCSLAACSTPSEPPLPGDRYPDLPQDERACAEQPDLPWCAE